jgi:cyclophilin family peptidyl-prolyl cis-trans isomerase/HEAT repeat protein
MRAMSRPRSRSPLFVRRLLPALAFILAAQPLFAQPKPADAPDTAAVLAAEAARASTAEQLDVLRRASLRSAPATRCAAVRALGRLERPGLVADIVPVLGAPDAAVRAEAANALAQAAGADAAAAATARAALLQHLETERDGDARGAVCEALGRLPVGSSEEYAVTERRLVDESTRIGPKKGVSVGPASPAVGLRFSWGKSPRTSTPAAIGALRGLESLLRLRGKARPPSQETIEELRWIAGNAVTMGRRLALLAMNAVDLADSATIDRALGDEDTEVRRLGAAASGISTDQLARVLLDREPAVRYEALRSWGRRFQAQMGCVPLVLATKDAAASVALLALDLLGGDCPAQAGAADLLASQASGAAWVSPAPATARAPAPAPRTTPTGWHRPAHALVSLARVAPDRARPLLPAFVAAEPWQVRMYAARAAAALGDASALLRLAADANANVREAAISGLARVRKHDADDVYLEALRADDGQLVISAAKALEGSPARQSSTAALVAALQRLTAAGSDTSRDPRLALLDRLNELGSRDAAASLEPILHDFDPAVARRAAQVLTSWTGEPQAAAPSVRPPEPLPSPAELDALSKSVLRVTMKGGGRFDVALLTDLAPLSAATIARLAASGYYNGLTFHRVVGNFVLQGGSPGANEFSGRDRFMRDEVGREMQARGTVGTSTRGRDTGDAQFYVNLVDNPRLDHDYTIFGRVTDGIDVVDRILEGDVIERVEVVRTGRRGR